MAVATKTGTANLVNLEAVTATVPGDASRVLLDAVSLGVARGERVGVVGLNGGGKTTLLEILSGRRAADAGRVSHRRDLRIAVLPQQTELPAGATVGEVVLATLAPSAEHEWAADARVRSVLDGLGIGDLKRSVDGLSGGERRRVALAAALVGELDLQVLDEPTNHLDVHGVTWLAEHVRDRGCAVVLVTHDRWFLDAVCTQTWEVVDGRVDSYEGGYADWVFARTERARLAQAVEERRRNLARKELAWLRRGAPARTSKPRFRIEAADALISDVPPVRNAPELLAFATRRLGRTVIELEDAVVELGGRRLLDGATWRLAPGQRVGVVGVNGSGKTTLLRALAGEQPLDAGRRIQGRTAVIAHLAQEQEEVPAGLRVLEATEDVARQVRLGRNELSASQVLERLGFPADRQWTPVAELSGGERRRLQLTRLLMAEPNVLLLDEPTNDLDIDTLQRLEDLLDSWPGTLVAVSHDRYFVERVCDDVVGLLGDGRITHLPGGIEEYLARTAGDPEIAPTRATTTRRQQPVSSSAAQQRTARKDAQRLERRLQALSERIDQLHDALAHAATDAPRLLALDAELREVTAELAETEQAWLAAAEAAEAG
ncbi:MAG: glycerophosphodiester phosphodiesterase [Pseudonocardia sp.]|nr:glycerophosphodiester phosphodiesterase [Pseudonocardia sp.]